LKKMNAFIKDLSNQTPSEKSDLLAIKKVEKSGHHRNGLREKRPTPDPVPADIYLRFFKAASELEKNFQYDSYARSYPAFIRFFENQELNEDRLIQGIHMIYGWMPTIFEFTCDGKLKDVLPLLESARNGTNLEACQLEILKSYLNNSLVGSSKLLHFLNPVKYPIWDSRICRFFFKKEPHQYRVGKVENYLVFKEWVCDVVQTPEFAKVHQLVDSKLGYTVSNVRAGELVLFLSGKERSDPKEGD
jgi:hypothetical protein